MSLPTPFQPPTNPVPTPPYQPPTNPLPTPCSSNPPITPQSWKQESRLLRARFLYDMSEPVNQLAAAREGFREAIEAHRAAVLALAVATVRLAQAEEIETRSRDRLSLGYINRLGTSPR